MQTEDSKDYSEHYYSIINHSLFKKISENEDLELLKVFERENRENSLTAGTLVGTDLIAHTPCIFRTKQSVVDDKGYSQLYGFYYLGKKLCGHEGIIHGGMLATLLDEALCFCGFAKLPNKVGVTAKLELQYLSPVMADNIVLLKANVKDAEGRKCWVDGEVFTVPSDFTGELDELPANVKASLLLVEPKWASKLDKKIGQ